MLTPSSKIREIVDQPPPFYRYDLVKSLRGKINDSIGNLIVEEVENLTLDPHENMEVQESVIEKVTDKVLNSPE